MLGDLPALEYTPCPMSDTAPLLAAHLPLQRLEKLGGGGMGVSTTQGHPARPERCAEVPSDDISQDRSGRAVRREARAASSLNHPNICTIYDIGEFEAVRLSP